MRPGQLLEVTVEKGVYRGLGLARVEGQALFVARGLPGDRLRVRVAAVERGFMRATIESVLEAGPQRCEAPCPYAGACGGCAYQELDYPAQLGLKEAVLRESLARGGAAWDGPIARHASPREGWRSRATLHVAVSAGGLRLGLREEGSHRVVDLPRCLQLSETMTAVVTGLRRSLEKRPALAARVHDVRLLESGRAGRVVVGLEGELGPADAPQLVGLQEGTPLAGLGARFGSGRARRYAHLAGDDSVVSEVLGRRYRIHGESFFQGNRFLVEDLARAVRDGVPRGGRVLDLYSGVGLFALTLADGAESVLGIEGNPQAVDDATFNAKDAGLGHVAFRSGEVEATLATIPIAAGERIVLDPPRSGAGAALLRAVAARAPASILYVSCDPPTLARDLKALAPTGYRVAELQMFDLFPDTFHLETVAVLRRD